MRDMADKIKSECSSSQHGFSYFHGVSVGRSVAVSHIDKDLFSVFVLLDGEMEYIIEGKRLCLSPKDMLLVGNNELHRSVFKEEQHCEYILLMVNLDFFIKHNCTDLSEMFFHRREGTGNVIKAREVLDSGLFDIVGRLDGYTKDETPNPVVVSSVIIELLYNLDRRIAKSERQYYKQGKVKEIIDYINGHFTEKLSLEMVANHFYLTRQYLCRLFKQATGFTVNHYIAYKRIVLVRELHLDGMPLSHACEKAGFGDYSAFYRAYFKIMNQSPRRSMSESSL